MQACSDFEHQLFVPDLDGQALFAALFCRALVAIAVMGMASGIRQNVSAGASAASGPVGNRICTGNDIHCGLCRCDNTLHVTMMDVWGPQVSHRRIFHARGKLCVAISR